MCQPATVHTLVHFQALGREQTYSRDHVNLIKVVEIGGSELLE